MESLNITGDRDNVSIFNKLYKQQERRNKALQKLHSKKIEITVAYNDPVDCSLFLKTDKINGTAYKSTPLSILKKFKFKNPIYRKFLKRRGIIIATLVDRKEFSIFAPLTNDCVLEFIILPFDVCKNDNYNHFLPSIHVDSFSLRTYEDMKNNILAMFFNCYKVNKCSDSDLGSAKIANVLPAKLGYKTNEDPNTETQLDQILDDLKYNLDLFFKLNKKCKIKYLQATFTEYCQFRLHTETGNFPERLKREGIFDRTYHIYKIGNFIINGFIDFVIKVEHLRHFIKARNYTDAMAIETYFEGNCDIVKVVTGLRLFPKLELKLEFNKQKAEIEKHDHCILSKRDNIFVFALPDEYDDPFVVMQPNGVIIMNKLKEIIDRFYKDMSFKHIRQDNVVLYPDRLWNASGLTSVLPTNRSLPKK